MSKTLFILLLSLQLAFGSSLLLTWADCTSSCADGGCPCEPVNTDCADASHADHGENRCPDSESDEQCPPGCDDCTCYRGRVVAVAPSIALRPQPLRSGAMRNARSADPGSVVPQRIFKPPRLSPV